MQNMARVVGGVFGQQRKKGWGFVCHGGSDVGWSSEQRKTPWSTGSVVRESEVEVVAQVPAAPSTVAAIVAGV